MFYLKGSWLQTCSLLLYLKKRIMKHCFHLLIPHLPNHLKETLSAYFWLHLSWNKQNWKMAIYHSMYASIYCNICSISHSQNGNNKHCHIFNYYQWFNAQFLVSFIDCALQCFTTLIFAEVKRTTQKFKMYRCVRATLDHCSVTITCLTL